MEAVYAQERFNSFYTKRIDLKTFFSTYTEELYFESYFRKKKAAALKDLLDIEDEKEFTKLTQLMNPRNALHSNVPKSFVPKRRFLNSWALYDMPSFDTNLLTLNNIKKEKKEEKYNRIKSIRYPGKIVMEVERMATDAGRARSLQPNLDYLVCVRILSLIGESKKYSPSQEILVPDRMTLEKIKDRIICEEDYALANPNIDRPYQCNQGRKMDFNQNGMFYIGETFYVDKRRSSAPEHDYSVEVIKWMSSRGLKRGNVEAMESTVLNTLHIRLGYPYLYIHQGRCEHLIMFTDARLVKRTDLLFLEDYPLLVSFASIKGRYCVLCVTRLAKLCVTDCDEIPYDNAFVCHLCAYSFLYDDKGQKKCSFKLYKYIDRAAII